MVFDEFDFQFLRLCGICRYIPTGLRRRFDSPYFHPAVLATLRSNGYIKLQSDKKSYKLTFAGRESLADMGYEFPEDTRMDLKRKAYTRKLKNALFNVTLHLAGIDIFADKTALLADKDTGYVSSLLLRSDGNIRTLAGTRFLGILKIYDKVYIPYYIEGADDWIVPTYEREIYKSQISNLKSVKDIRLLLTGENLEELWKNIHPKEPSRIQGKGMKRFDEALEEMGRDFHLVPLNRDGVTQLNIMHIWRYRERIAKAIGCITDKVYNLSDCDGFVDNTPYIIAIDLNIPKILRALKQIQLYNDKIVPKICCLPFQKKTVIRLMREYRTQNAIILSLDKDNIYQNIFNEYVPKDVMQRPYVSKEGEYINANQRKVTKDVIDTL